MQSKAVWQKLLITIGIIILTAVCSYLNVLGEWDSAISDLMNQKPGHVNKNIYIIGIDDKTLEQYGMTAQWGRRLSGELIEKLNEHEDCRPAVIGLDIIYSESVDEDGDRYFAEACGKAGNVVTVSSFVFKGQPQSNEKGVMTYNPYVVKYLVEPYEELRENVQTGFANTTVDNDGYVRQAMAKVSYEGEDTYSFPFVIYRQYLKSRGEEPANIPTYGAGNQYYFSYSGMPGDYTVISMVDVLEGRVDTRIFQDAIVLVGAYAVGMQDAYKPAIAHQSEMYGVEIHANIIQALLEEKTQLPFSKVIFALLTGVLCGGFYLLAARGRILWTTAALGGAVLGNFLLVKGMYRMGYIVPVLLLPIVFLMIYAVSLIRGYLTERLRRRRVVSVFKQYVAPQLVDQISRDKNYELVLGGELRQVAVLFVDIRGFTTISEQLNPKEVVEILNEYLSLTTSCILEYNGMLDKFIGDAAMAVFNAPFDLDDYIFKAVCAAWDMKTRAGVLEEKFRERFGRGVSFGIGINCGNAVVGNIGCDFRMDYTTIGDTVNTAARLENNAGAGQILISDRVYKAVKDRILVTPVGALSLKGKDEEIFVYQVDGVQKER